MTATTPFPVYADTSVFGGDGFDEASQAFFQQVKKGDFQLVVSPIVEDEIEKVPENVRQYFNEITKLAKFIDISEEALQLRKAYLDANAIKLSGFIS